jgi:carbonic anhydrase
MDTLEGLFQNNQRWSKHKTQLDPQFFQRLSSQQSPKYLWIGCSDSRVPANEILGLEPGEIFVHRNIANLVVHSDLNCLSVIQYAVEILEVEHIMVVGHYGCGGVQAVIQSRTAGLSDNWLRHIEDLKFKYRMQLHKLDYHSQFKAMVELNVVEQVAHVCRTKILRKAWYRGQPVNVHGLVYGLQDGLLRRVGGCVSDVEGWYANYTHSIEQILDKQKVEG